MKAPPEIEKAARRSSPSGLEASQYGSGQRAQGAHQWPFVPSSCDESRVAHGRASKSSGKASAGTKAAFTHPTRDLRLFRTKQTSLSIEPTARIAVDPIIPFRLGLRSRRRCIVTSICGR
jgi:hypothetical protein